MWSQITFWLLRSSSDPRLKTFARNAPEIHKCAHTGKHRETRLCPQRISLVLEAPRAFANSQKLLQLELHHRHSKEMCQF